MEPTKQPLEVQPVVQPPVPSPTKKPESPPRQKLLSATQSTNDTESVKQRPSRLHKLYHRSESKSKRTASVGTRASAADSDDEVEKQMPKTKLVRFTEHLNSQSSTSVRSSTSISKEYCTVGEAEACIVDHGHSCKVLLTLLALTRQRSPNGLCLTAVLLGLPIESQ